MLSSLLNAPCELQLHLLQSVVFLYPTQGSHQTTDPEGPPSQTDSLVRGLVELWVPSARHITGIKVKLRAIQTVAILDTNFGLIPVSWEDDVLMEKEVRIGMTPKSASHAKKERGRTPGPSSIRLGSSRAGSRAPSPSSGESRRGRNESPAASRNATARNSLEVRDLGEAHDHDREGIHNVAAQLHSAFTKVVSRGHTTSRPNSQPDSRGASRSRAPSPVESDRRLGLFSFASTSIYQARHAASLTPALLPASPQQSPREENSRRPSVSRATSSSSSLNGGLATLSIGAGVERQREAQNAAGLGHPDDDDFGISRRARDAARGRQPALTQTAGFGAPAAAADLGRGTGGLARRSDESRGAAGGSVPPSVSKQKQRDHSAGLNWSRWGRSVSRVRGAPYGKERNFSRPPSLRQTHSSEHQDDDEDVLRSSGTEKGEQGLELEKGVHGFEFAFMIPADSPEYTRSPFGRVRYFIKATAYGAGRAKSNLESWRDCFPVANPSTEGAPTPLTVMYNDLHPTVGLLSIACTSQNISVGGLFQLDIHSPVPPHDLVVYLVRVSLETNIEIRTKRKGRQKVPSQRHKLFQKGYVPLRKDDPHVAGDGNKSDGYVRDPARDGAESAWTVQGLARIPDDNSIRSSTMGGTKAAIRFSHQIVVEVVHSRESDPPGSDRRLKVFTLRQFITLPSCCVAFDAATLPAYTAASDGGSSTVATGVNGMPYDLAHLPNGARNEQMHSSQPHSEASGSNEGASFSTPSAGNSAAASSNIRRSTLDAHRGASHDFCVCGLSLQDLEARERAMMMPPESASYDIPIDALRPHGKIGELPYSSLRRSCSRSSRRGSMSSQRSASLAGNIARRRSPSTSSISGGAAGVAAALVRSVNRSTTTNAERDPSAIRNGRSGSIARVRSRGSTSTVASGEASSNSPVLTSGAPISPMNSTSSARSGQSLPRIDDEGGRAPVIAEGEEPPSYDSAVLEKEIEEETDIRGRRR